LYTGTFLNADTIVRTVDEKKALAESYGAIAVDMESFAVAQVCRETQTRFLAVRVISDDMSTDLPREIHAVVQSGGYRRVGAAAGAMWHRPASFREMWRLWNQAQTAAERLAVFLEGVLPQLYEARH
jgi:adenosylhomocysteine nucleosidase